MLRATLVLFALIAGHTLLETARDALFLGELPASRLAWVYAALAALAMLATHFSRSLISKFGQRSALFLTLIVSAYGAIVFYLMPQNKGVVFSLYLYSGLMGSVAVVQFWMLASRWFTVAQGKRLFGLVSSGGVLGAVAGATLAMAALRVVAVDKLLLVAAACFMVAGLVLTATEDDLVPSAVHQPGIQLGALKELRRHPYLAWLAVLLALSTGALLTTDYLFKSVAARLFAAEQLGGFFASYYAALNGLALVVQLAVSGYVVRRLGVVAAFLVLPLLLLGGAALLLSLGGVLAVVLVTKGADGGLRHSLHRVTSELLWMPLPEEVRSNSKSFVDTVVVRVSQAATAGVLLFLASKNWDDARTLALLLAGSLVAWLAVGFGLRKPYLALFREALTSAERGHHDLDLDLNAVGVVVESLSSREPARAIAAIELLAANDRAKLIPALILYHESEEVLLSALPVIATPERKDWVPLAERLLDHESRAVQVQALRMLSRAGMASAVEARLRDDSPEVRGHAAFLLADHSTHPSQHPAVREIMALEGPNGVTARHGLLDSVRALADQRYVALLLEVCDDPDEQVLNAAALAMTRVQDPRFIPFLIRRLAVRHGRESVREALVAHGTAALTALCDLLADPATDPSVRRHIPKTLASFETQAAADMLMDQMARETHGLVRYKLLKGLQSLVQRTHVAIKRPVLEAQLKENLVEHLRMAHYRSLVGSSKPITSAAADLLGGFLEDKLKQALERAFMLLGILHPNEDIKSVSAAVSSEDSKTRAKALEYLDALTLDARVTGLRQLLSVAVDDLPIEEQVRRARSELPALPQNEHQLLQLLMRDPDGALAAIAAYYALEFDSAAFHRQIVALNQEQPSSMLAGVLGGQLMKTEPNFAQ